MQKLIARSDVFISNIRPNALERLGLDARACLSCKPDLIHCLITGFGLAVLSGRPAYDTVLQGASGMAASRRFGRNPELCAVPAVDHVVGRSRRAPSRLRCSGTRTGRGIALEIPMHETMRFRA